MNHLSHGASRGSGASSVARRGIGAGVHGWTLHGQRCGGIDGGGIIGRGNAACEQCAQSAKHFHARGGAKNRNMRRYTYQCISDALPHLLDDDVQSQCGVIEAAVELAVRIDERRQRHAATMHDAERRDAAFARSAMVAGLVTWLHEHDVIAVAGRAADFSRRFSGARAAATAAAAAAEEESSDSDDEMRAPGVPSAAAVAWRETLEVAQCEGGALCGTDTVVYVCDAPVTATAALVANRWMCERLTTAMAAPLVVEYADVSYMPSDGDESHVTACNGLIRMLAPRLGAWAHLHVVLTRTHAKISVDSGSGGGWSLGVWGWTHTPPAKISRSRAIVRARIAVCYAAGAAGLDDHSSVDTGGKIAAEEVSDSSEDNGAVENDGAENEGVENDGSGNDGAAKDGAAKDGTAKDGVVKEGAAKDGAGKDETTAAGRVKKSE